MLKRAAPFRTEHLFQCDGPAQRLNLIDRPHLLPHRVEQRMGLPESPPRACGPVGAIKVKE